MSWDTRPALVDYIANIAAEPVLYDGWLDFDVTAGILTALDLDGYLTLWIEANGDTGDKGYIQFASREAGPASMPHLGLRKE